MIEDIIFSTLLRQITTKLTIQMGRKLTTRRYIILLIFSDMLLTLSCEEQVYSLTDEQSKRDEVNNPAQLNALQRSVQRNILEVWYYKETFKSLQDILLTPKLLNNAVIERETTKLRLQNIMTRALLGQDIGVIVMGGSISAGGGLMNDYSVVNGVYYRVFIDWWQKAIQPFTDSKVVLRNLAVGGTSSNFYSYCYKTLLKPQDSLDIVFLEFSLNDMFLFKHSSLPMASSLEKLTRSVLSEPNSPAVIFVNFIRGELGIAQCDNLENHGQTMLAWHYGITSVGLRSSLCPNPGNIKTPAMFSSDGYHASIIGHAQIALMIIDSARNALLGAIDNAQLGLLREPSRQLPRHVFYSMEKDNSGTKPLCFSLITPDINDKYFNPSLYAKETKNIGFQEVHNEAIGFRKRAQGDGMVAPSRSDGFGGWQAEKENSTLKLQICLPQDNMLGFNVTRSVVVVFRTNGFGGKARIWLDDRKPGIVINTYSVFEQTHLATVANHVTSGCHSLNVNTVNAGKSTLCGVLAGASSA